MAKEITVGEVCPICRQPIDVFVRMTEPFLFAKKLEHICFVCYSVPKMWYWEGEEYKTHPNFNEKTVHTIDEMVGHGFNKKEAQTSIKAVLNFWKKWRKT